MDAASMAAQIDGVQAKDKGNIELETTDMRGESINPLAAEHAVKVNLVQEMVSPQRKKRRKGAYRSVWP
jgi:hypothetical protein